MVREAGDVLKTFFFLFPQGKNRFDISCDMSA